MSIAVSRLIEKFGSRQALALAAGVTVKQTYVWGYPKDRGGTDGMIPGPRQKRIRESAYMQGIKLDWYDFFPDPPEAVR